MNGVIIDIVSVDGRKNCKCNTCDGAVTVILSFFPVKDLLLNLALII